MKKNVAKKGDQSKVSRAEQNLAALIKNGVKCEDFEPASGLNGDELDLIFEMNYAQMDGNQREREAKNLQKIVERERMQAEREELAEAIRAAEEAGDDEKVDELMRKMQSLNSRAK